MSYTAIVDYGVGNLKSVSNALSYVGLDNRITGDAGELERSNAILLPGVGAFPDAARKLRQTGLDEVILRAGREKPVLGICLGMQLLFARGEEGEDCLGLGVVPGVVKRMETQYKLPHIGWNSLSFPNPSPLFRGLEEGAWVYFVHSFSGRADDPTQVIATTDYGMEVVAAVQNGNFFGTQFHPEKSGDVGLEILKNFGAMNP
ncbi:MAG TPA: imidazole glycerol phosphate synthase subunit HisH [Candidatus Enterenecus avicola]|nr:imidazole glycerol phosphate synthase subunit HisH [Candidatus Enterenecus avicola]